MNPTKPVVKLLDYSKNPFNLAIATARTCYSSKGILLPTDMDKDEKSIEIRDKVAKSTKKAGHLTTRQHPQFIFTLDQVSRQFVWSFLHSHPYYNSEQVSQRYVEVKKENFYIPGNLSESSLNVYIHAIEYSIHAYKSFIDVLQPYIANEYFKIFRARANYPEKWQNPIKKRCLEVARYLLPLGTYTYLFHTINGLTLHRYNRLMNSYDVPMEQKNVVLEMIRQVEEVDPLFVSEFDDPMPLEETMEFQFFSDSRETKKTPNDLLKQSKIFNSEFDEELEGQYSKLVSYSENSEKVLCDSVRSILGLSRLELNDENAIHLLLSPAKNHHLTSTLNETSLSKISRALFNVHYTFKKKISHTADSQDQRHRMVPGGRPILHRQISGEPDFITPNIINLYPELKEKYFSHMEVVFKNVTNFIHETNDFENATYLLPNAFPIRFYESGDLLNLHHKWKSRTCYNAQEEIFQASVDEIKQVTKVHPNLGKWFKAPCWIRLQGETKPYCPEGDHFCGIQVWKKEIIEDYNRVI